MKWTILVDYSENAGGVEAYGEFASSLQAGLVAKAAQSRFEAMEDFRDVTVRVVPLRPATALGVVS